MAMEKAPTIEFIPDTGKIQRENIQNQPNISGSVDEEKFDSISSMADLKEKAPEMYQAMMQNIGLKICRDTQRHQKRFKQILRKNRE